MVQSHKSGEGEFLALGGENGKSQLFDAVSTGRFTIVTLFHINRLAGI